jgi:hypothetical protein
MRHALVATCDIHTLHAERVHLQPDGGSTFSRANAVHSVDTRTPRANSRKSSLDSFSRPLGSYALGHAYCRCGNWQLNVIAAGRVHNNGDDIVQRGPHKRTSLRS